MMESFQRLLARGLGQAGGEAKASASTFRHLLLSRTGSPGQHGIGNGAPERAGLDRATVPSRLAHHDGHRGPSGGGDRGGDARYRAAAAAHDHLLSRFRDAPGDAQGQPPTRGDDGPVPSAVVARSVSRTPSGDASGQGGVQQSHPDQPSLLEEVPATASPGTSRDIVVVDRGASAQAPDPTPPVAAAPSTADAALPAPASTPAPAALPPPSDGSVILDPAQVTGPQAGSGPNAVIVKNSFDHAITIGQFVNGGSTTTPVAWITLEPGQSGVLRHENGQAGVIAMADASGTYQPNAARLEYETDPNGKMSYPDVSDIDGRNAAIWFTDGKGLTKGDQKSIAAGAPAETITRDAAGGETIAGDYDDSTPVMKAGYAYMESALPPGGSYQKPNDDTLPAGQNPMGGTPDNVISATFSPP